MTVKIKKRRYISVKKTTIRVFAILLFVFALAHVCLLESKAADLKTLTDISAPFTDSPENHIPEQTIEQDGEVYRLDRYNVIDVTIPEQTVIASDTIIYNSVEAQDRIPATAEIQVTNSNTGTVETKTVPLKEYQYTDYRWIDGFRIPVTVEDADADYYAMNDVLIPNTESDPFAGYEDALLDFVGLDHEAYIIDKFEWASDPWTENGIVYRQALATGRKYVATVRATYEGMVTLEEVAAKEVHANYILEEEPKSEETERIGDHEVNSNGDDAGDQKDKDNFWKRLLRPLMDFIKNHPFISIGLLIIILSIILILHQLSKKEKKQGDEKI